MWVLNFLPNWIFTLILAAGIAGLTASYVLLLIPFIKKYLAAVRVASVALIVVGVWFQGAIHNQQTWERRVKELEVKVAEAEAKSQKENVKVVEKVVTKREYYKVRGNDIVQYVDREIVKYDNRCEIPNEFIEVHNKAATR